MSCVVLHVFTLYSDINVIMRNQNENLFKTEIYCTFLEDKDRRKAKRQKYVISKHYHRNYKTKSPTEQQSWYLVYCKPTIITLLHFEKPCDTETV